MKKTDHLFFLFFKATEIAPMFAFTKLIQTNKYRLLHVRSPSTDSNRRFLNSSMLI